MTGRRHDSTLSKGARRPRRRRRTAAAFHHIEGRAAGLRTPLSQVSPGRTAQAEVSFSAYSRISQAPERSWLMTLICSSIKPIGARPLLYERSVQLQCQAARWSVASRHYPVRLCSFER